MKTQTPGCSVLMNPPLTVVPARLCRMNCTGPSPAPLLVLTYCGKIRLTFLWQPGGREKFPRACTKPRGNGIFFPMRKILLAVLCCGLLCAAAQKPAASIPDLPALQAMAARFAPTALDVDVSSLSPGDQKA